ncbi:hypothetical protein PACTADRAFT_35829 [Pachysolen tannophilus NRRL Y-2460]|uniref:Kynurenine 3-monooxygenase n=1 Tax=Pachysolen tannophilus NRRL Y-2460 TaxID=669874 RepID=A0A1E4TNE9_PACTA|nr:hypothetical protein PACTADRAFT_35829 [Pachysolen tannophilus NRRL Y-2460]
MSAVVSLNQEKEKEVGVIGAGLVGCLTALALQKKGYKVILFELRQDPRLKSTKEKNLRSINLAISDRGIKALKYVDENLAKKVLDKVIPMRGRMIHDSKGNQESQLYGLYGESIKSIDRGYLNQELLNEIDIINKSGVGYPIEVLFGKKLINLSFLGEEENPTVTIVDQSSHQEQIFEFDFIVSADGAFSATRHYLQRYVRMTFKQEFIDTCYIELSIPAGPGNSFLIDPNHLHIWPRDKFMLIALPNQNGSFTSTFFSSWELAESLNTDTKILNFFKEHFEDGLKLIGEDNLISSFKNNPKGSLVQIHCNPYNYKGKAILIGDAAHGMVPFYGQGMNCGFESLRILLEMLEKNNFNTEKAFNQYSKERHQDLEVILKLALDNYNEMSHDVTSIVYLMRKKIDSFLGRLLRGKWLPLYTMISFRGDIPYSEAISIEKRQQNIIKKLEAAIFVGTIYAAVKISKYFASKFVK